MPCESPPGSWAANARRCSTPSRPPDSTPTRNLPIMVANALFVRLPAQRGSDASPPTVSVFLNDTPLALPADTSLAAGLLAAGVTRFRNATVSGAARAPYCMMGVCFECLVEIDGVPSQQACLVRPREACASAPWTPCPAWSFLKAAKCAARPAAQTETRHEPPSIHFPPQ